MASSNCVADVRKLLVKAVKSGDTTVQAPSKWASQAGYDGSAASPLRQHMARANGNGCGRTRRYPKVSAEQFIEVLDMADAYAAEAEQRKRDALSKRIGTKLRPVAVTGAKQAKEQAKRSATTKPKKAAVTAEA